MKVIVGFGFVTLLSRVLSDRYVYRSARNVCGDKIFVFQPILMIKCDP